MGKAALKWWVGLLGAVLLAPTLALAEPAPRAVRIPLSNGAGYPFSNHLYRIRVGGAYGQSEYSGIVKKVYYGFTPRTKAQYLEHNDVPWFNARGEAVAEGALRVSHRHDGSYKGSMIMNPLPEIQVPEGMNLVFKLALEKWWGEPWGGRSRLGERAETMTYFVEVP